MLNPAIESAIIEQLLLLDDDRKAEVLNFILSLTAQSKVVRIQGSRQPAVNFGSAEPLTTA
jgi:hypothetical protein